MSSIIIIWGGGRGGDGGRVGTVAGKLWKRHTYMYMNVFPHSECGNYLSFKLSTQHFSGISPTCMYCYDLDRYAIC